MSKLTFKVDLPQALSCPRVGRAHLERVDVSKPCTLEVATPGFITTTSRGVVPHLSRDHCELTKAIRWIHVPFETFLERTPPVPTLVGGESPLHRLLSYAPSQFILSMSLRDPRDDREMPPNGDKYVSAYCIRGVRKVEGSTWRSFVHACNPDIVTALSDTPFTRPPHSQKRSIKSVERSLAWLSDLLHFDPVEVSHPCNILVHMAGGTDTSARKAFAEGITGILYGKDAEAVRPLKTLDEGVAGYVFDLAPLRIALKGERIASEQAEVSATFDSRDGGVNSNLDFHSYTPRLISLMNTSLASLPWHKLRIAHSTVSPHEILRMIQLVGVDLFDAHWVQSAASVGVALDFQFPVPFRYDSGSTTDIVSGTSSRKRKNGKYDLGRNLYDQVYAHDFARLAEVDYGGTDIGPPKCPCGACSPPSSLSCNPHSANGDNEPTEQTSTQSYPLDPPFTRAYIHHLLHTHEMSSHSLLTMHNLAILDSFFSGIRSILNAADGLARFDQEVDAFEGIYDEQMDVFDEATKIWSEVELARGKGRLAREKTRDAVAA